VHKQVAVLMAFERCAARCLNVGPCMVKASESRRAQRVTGGWSCEDERGGRGQWDRQAQDLSYSPGISSARAKAKDLVSMHPRIVTNIDRIQHHRSL